MNNTRFRLLCDIFITFCKIAPITFGGGFAIIPVLEAEIVDKKKWIDREKIVDVFAVSQSVPGAVAVNSAIFLGYRIAGVAGALSAMLGMIIPTSMIILLLSALFLSLQSSAIVHAALKGIRPVIIALIAAAAYKMGKSSFIDMKCWCIGAISIVTLLLFKNLNIVIIIAAGALTGIMITKVAEAAKKVGILPKTINNRKSSGKKV